MARLRALIAVRDGDDENDHEDDDPENDSTPARSGAEDGPSLLARIKSQPGAVRLESMLTEIDKLLTVRRIGLPDGLFGDVDPKVLAGWWAQAVVESPSHLCARSTTNEAKTLTLLTTLLHTRHREITDARTPITTASLSSTVICGGARTALSSAGSVSSSVGWALAGSPRERHGQHHRDHHRDPRHHSRPAPGRGERSARRRACGSRQPEPAAGTPPQRRCHRPVGWGQVRVQVRPPSVLA